MSRRSIHIEGFDHGGQPIPAACRVGNIVMTGGVYGFDYDHLPANMLLQCDAVAVVGA
jgi:hypothetical protein